MKISLRTFHFIIDQYQMSMTYGLRLGSKVKIINISYFCEGQNKYSIILIFEAYTNRYLLPSSYSYLQSVKFLITLNTIIPTLKLITDVDKQCNYNNYCHICGSIFICERYTQYTKYLDILKKFKNIRIPYGYHFAHLESFVRNL